MDRPTVSGGALLAFIGCIALVPSVAADVAVNPARIQQGSCPETGATVAVLQDVVGEWMSDPIGSADPVTYPVRASITHAAAVPYEDLFATPHSVLVDLAPGMAPVLCGDLRGYPLTPSDIAIGLGEVNDSGFSGIATVHDDGDGTVDVEVYLTTRDAWVGDVD